MKPSTFTITVHQEDEFFVADCFEVGTVSQGTTIEESIQNLKEATELYLEEFPNRFVDANKTIWNKNNLL